MYEKIINSLQNRVDEIALKTWGRSDCVPNFKVSVYRYEFLKLDSVVITLRFDGVEYSEILFHIRSGSCPQKRLIGIMNELVKRASEDKID